MKTLSIVITTAAALALPWALALRAQDTAHAVLTHPEDAVRAAQLAPGAPLPPPAWAGVPGGDFSTRLQGIITRASSPGSAVKPLVIQTSNPDPKDQADLEEDLAVMAHILDKALENVPGTPWRGGGAPQAMGIDVLLAPGSSQARNLYLDGYGALFLLNVHFPLVPPAAKADEEKPSGDSTWEEAKQELYGGESGARAALPPAEQFSQDKVNKLKTTLLETLKNASNIRGLKPDESVTICVQGGPGGAFPRAGRRFAGGGTAGGGGAYGGSFVFAHSGGPTQGTMMTIRVKKTDVDAFAKGKMDLNEFQKHARVTTYATSADPGATEAGLGSSASAGGGGGGGGFGR